MMSGEHFVLGLDLDGVVADFYGFMRRFIAEYRGIDVETLPSEVSFDLTEWGVPAGGYEALHRAAVTGSEMFRSLEVLPGAADALGRLSDDGVRIRVITHRLYLSSLHAISVAQTVDWLDEKRIPYWDLCFMREKGAVGADLYLEDSPHNIDALRSAGKDVIVYTNSANRHLPSTRDTRAEHWEDAEKLIRDRHERWKRGHD